MRPAPTPILWRRLTTLALIPFLIATSGCALTIKGTVQTVPVTSNPPGAEVFIDGALAGTTPITVELSATQPHSIVLRLGEQEQRVELVNQSSPLWITLDAVPAVLGGAALVTAATCDDSLVCVGFLVIAIPVALIGATPIVVDAATGAWQQLSPGEVVIDFE